ncbi:MAG: hypothetical protein ACK5N0_07265 [Synechococcaceae cyanobacterium]
MTPSPGPGDPPSAPANPIANAPANANPTRPGASAPSPLSGRRVLAAGLVTGVIGLALAFFLQALVANTPVRISSTALVWSSVLLSASGLGAGMALEAVRQLSQNNPDPAYRRPPRGRPPAA